MNGRFGTALSIGASGGWLEYKKSFSNRQDAFNYFGVSLLFVGTAYLLRDSEVEGTDIPLGAMFLAGAIGFIVAMSGIVTVGQVLATEREDGTLLRSKALPDGMLAYIVSKTVHILLVTLTNTVFVLVPAFFVLDDFALSGPGSLMTLGWVLVIGLAATVPIGAVLGALVKSPRATMGVLMIPIMGISMVSGIFVPILAMPAWGQLIAQIFPVYWIGLGTRSVFLPDAMLPAEIDASWRHLETLGVLGAWAVVGLAVAPVLLRRMARRESGSQLSEARERALNSVV